MACCLVGWGCTSWLWQQDVAAGKQGSDLAETNGHNKVHFTTNLDLRWLSSGKAGHRTWSRGRLPGWTTPQQQAGLPHKWLYGQASWADWVDGPQLSPLLLTRPAVHGLLQDLQLVIELGDEGALAERARYEPSLQLVSNVLSGSQLLVVLSRLGQQL